MMPRSLAVFIASSLPVRVACVAVANGPARDEITKDVLRTVQVIANGEVATVNRAWGGRAGDDYNDGYGYGYGYDYSDASLGAADSYSDDYSYSYSYGYDYSDASLGAADSYSDDYSYSDSYGYDYSDASLGAADFGAGNNNTRPLLSRRQVFVFRHCIRSTSGAMKHVLPGFESKSNYTNMTLPEYFVGENLCTPTGVEVMEAIGRSLLTQTSLGADSSTELKVFADTVLRDRTTASALLRGLGREDTQVQFKPTLFDTTNPEPPATALCDHGHTDEETAEAIRQRIAVVKPPSDISTALADMQALVGIGPAGPLTALPNISVNDSSGVISGGVRVLKSFGQDMFYTFASGPQGQSRPGPWVIDALTPEAMDQRYEWIAWQHYMRSIKNFGPEEAAENAALLRAAATDMLETEGAGVTLHVGHDGNLDGLALLLNVEWDAPPYRGGKLLPTPPGGSLMFERGVDGSIEIRYVYTVMSNRDGTLNTDGKLHLSPVRDQESGEELPPLSPDAFRARIQTGIKRYSGGEACYERASSLIDSMGLR